MTRKILATAATSAALIVTFGSTAAFAGMPDNFSAIDANSDGQVTYKEYAKVVTADKKMTPTAAAQEFIKISGSDAVITEGELITAVAVESQAQWDTSTTVVPASDLNLESNTEFMSDTDSGAYSEPEIVAPEASTPTTEIITLPEPELVIDPAVDAETEAPIGIQVEGDVATETDTSTTMEIKIPEPPEVKTELDKNPMN